jgi:hypothetical protein
MNPVRGYTMLNFLDWLEKHHPHITSLRNLSKKELLNLVGNFGCGQSINNGCLAGKWLAGFDLLFRRIGNFLEYDLAREKLKLIETRSNHLIAEFKELGANFKNNKGYREYDFLARYRNVPLHALFLYTSEDEYVAEYILRNWGALDTLSGENCDIYPSLEQFHNLEDAYDYIEELTVLDGNEILEYSELPGIFFWDNSGNTEYVSLEQDVMPNQIKFIIRTIFGEINKNQSIRSVTIARKRIVRKELMDSHENYHNLAGALNCNEIATLKQILTRSLNLQTTDDRRDFLSICGLEKVGASIQLDKPLSQFIINLLAQLARVYIEADSSKRIGLVIFLEFISKIDSSLSEKDKQFIEYILIKLKRSFPQTQDLECLN